MRSPCTSTCILLLLLPAILVQVHPLPLSSDVRALLSFKSHLAADHNRSVSGWDLASSPDHCNWTGVSCDARRRVSALSLPSLSLSGTLPPSLSDLSSLAVLDLSSNSFSGPIPALPGTLRELSLASNLLSGAVPAHLGALGRLTYLSLDSNRLSGPIPPSLFCNWTSLRYLDLSSNSLLGPIPLRPGCNLPSLWFLLLWSNHLTGPIPGALANSTAIRWIDLSLNRLSGELPTDIVGRLTQLKYLHLSHNQFSSHANNTDLGPFFAALAASGELKELTIAGNGLGGTLPPSVGNLSKSLIQLHLEENHITGLIPPEISALANLTYLNLSNNLLAGPIPGELCNIIKLEQLDLTGNMLSGPIPPGIGRIPHLGLLHLSRNLITGAIPDTFSGLKQLRRLLLDNNNVSGEIPTALGSCENLEILDLSNNRLTGLIPTAVASLANLKLCLNLSFNLLDGPLPLELTKMSMLQKLDLSMNNITGHIPPQLSSCIALEYLDLSSNKLDGPLPASIGDLPYLQVLDLSKNKLIGPLPDTLQASNMLKHLNLSYNRLSGPVPKHGLFASMSPDSLLGNPDLCGELQAMRRCSADHAAKRKILIILLPTAVIMLACLPCTLWLIPRRLLPPMSSIHRRAVACRSSDFPRIPHKQLMEATGGFCSSNLIGSGRFGQVYKGVLRDGTKVAVKVLGGEVSGSFKRECEVLKWTRHRNLIRIITTCSRPDFNALVLPLMGNGSLEGFLYNAAAAKGRRLDVRVVVSVLNDVAQGLAYLHHQSPLGVVHCDLKPSNVLLDDDMTAVLTDFGISKLLEVDRSHCDQESQCDSTTGLLCGSLGYMAPEYGLGRAASREGDVYSFGVLVLEMLTGKRPTDVLFQEGWTLQDWVRAHFPHDLVAAVHGHYVRQTEMMLWPKLLEELADLGLKCTQAMPPARPSMLVAARKLAQLKEELAKRAEG